jgi:hypothetical protein
VARSGLSCERVVLRCCAVLCGRAERSCCRAVLDVPAPAGADPGRQADYFE